MIKEANLISTVIRAGVRGARFLKNSINFEDKIRVFDKAQEGFYTNVDILSQHVLETNIRAEYPEVKIVSEESFDDIKRKTISNEFCFNFEEFTSYEQNRARKEEATLLNEISRIFAKKNTASQHKLVNIDEVKIVIDPLDGTNSFISKDYKFTTVLIGILRMNQPYFGFIADPFEKESLISLYFNIPGVGVYKLKMENGGGITDFEKISETKENELDLNLITSIRKYSTVVNSLESFDKATLATLFSNYSITPLNGMGYRSIKVINQNSAFVSLDTQMSYWDICAPNAICSELKGGCFVLETGHPLNYDFNLRKTVEPNFILGRDIRKIQKLIDNQIIINH